MTPVTPAERNSNPGYGGRRGDPRSAPPGRAAGEPWFGFEAVRALDGLPPEILVVPLPGHTWGHAGIAVDRGAEGWLLHAGDAYFYRHEVRRAKRKCTPGLRGYQTMMEVDRDRRLANQARLRALPGQGRGREDDLRARSRGAGSVRGRPAPMMPIL